MSQVRLAYEQGRLKGDLNPACSVALMIHLSDRDMSERMRDRSILSAIANIIYPPKEDEAEDVQVTADEWFKEFESVKSRMADAER